MNLIKLEFDEEEVDRMVQAWLRYQYPEIMSRVQPVKKKNIYVGDYSLDDKSIYANLYISVELEEL